MDPHYCFPIMAVGRVADGRRSRACSFIKVPEIDLRIVLGLAIGGIPAVLVAALIVKSMHVDILRYVITIVVVLHGDRDGARRDQGAARASARGRDGAAGRVMTKSHGAQPRVREIRPGREGAYLSAGREATRDEFDEDYRIATLDFEPFLHGDAADKARFAEEFAGALQRDRLRGPDRPRRRRRRFTTKCTRRSRAVHEHAARREDALPGRAATDRSTRAISRSRRRAKSIPTWSRAGCGAGARSTFRSSGTRRFAPKIFGRAPNMSAQFRRLVEAHEPLFKPIAQAMFRGLGSIRTSMTRSSRGTNFGLRLNYYPPMTRRRRTQSGAGRLLGHEDVDLFTILPATRIDGLQVWNHRSGKWVRMRAPHGSIIINTGDYMQRITQRPAAFDDPPRRQAERRVASVRRLACRSRWRSTCGRTSCWRCCRASANPNIRR